MSQNTLIIGSLETMLSTERTRLIRLCAYFSGNVDAAEDLAQETLLEAWRHIDELRDHEHFAQWLSGIARNICLRWARKRGHDLSRLAASHESQSAILFELEDQIADDFDLEVELEQKELVELLDRALALLPPETRAVLIARYVEESPLAEVAARLSLNISTVSMRLQRGKLALRRVLSHELGQQMAEHLLLAPDRMEETRIWCSYCGQHKLRGLLVPDEALLELECPACGCHSYSNFAKTVEADMFRGIKSYKPALSRRNNWVTRYYSPNLATKTVHCLHCGHSRPLFMASPSDDRPAWIQSRYERGIYHSCEPCNSQSWATLGCLVLSSPEGHAFYRNHPRIRTLPEREIEVNGRAAIVSSFESLTTGETFNAISASDTFELLHVSGSRP